MSLPTARLSVLACLVILASAVPMAQAPPDPLLAPNRVAVQATTPSELRTWDTTIDRMVRASQMVVMASVADPDIEGRRHESLLQSYQGVPVYGGGLSRQTANGATVSILGTLFDNVTVDVSPTLSADQIVAGLIETTGGRLVAGARLVIVPTLGGEYRLAYRATMSDMKTYLVDASSGTVLLTTDEMKTQSQVGVGTGSLGDAGKMSTTQVAGVYRALDQLRPAPIRTLDTRGSEVAFNRLTQSQGVAVDADYSVDADNTWSDPPAVDTHVHVGLMEDYLYKQHSWTGIDNRRGMITAAVHTGLINNAFFTPPPFGVDGRGMFVFGRVTTGAPLTSLDFVGHEMMHGVTDASLTQRTGNGLLDALFSDRLGPASFTSAGASYPCTTTLVSFTDGSRYPFLCSSGRFLTVSNHPGALNEAFSDIFGISAEFFHQPAGTGPLRADYKLGEDVAGFGPNRAADVPASLIAASTSVGTIPYPDHASRTFSFLVVVTQGTPANPIAVRLLPWVLQGSQLGILQTTDGGGVHFNSTVMSHAFYLAIEGGRNATSGLTVQGVGAANRAQIERAFFRAMTVLMPNVPSMTTAAQATVQAAVDLYGASSPAAAAVRQAMQAVGLIN